MSRVLRVVFDALVLVLVGWQVYDVAAAFIARRTAELDLEWMEGATLITGLRAGAGEPFYTLPQPDYIPFIYPPLYAWILGVLSQFLPLGYTLGRSVSIACTSGAVVALVWAARQEGARWPLALGAGALFLGCYEEAGTFYDLVRIDSLAMFLTGAALACGRVESTRGAVASGLLLALAFTAKHNMALFGVPIVLWRWRTLGLRNALLFAASSAGPALAFVAAMQVYTEGLFLTYLTGVPAYHGSVWTRGLPNIQKGKIEGAQAEIVRALPILASALFASAGRWGRSRGGSYWGGALVTAVVMASVMRAHQGGYLNVLIPAFWLVAVLLPLLESALLSWTSAGRMAVARAWVPAGVSLLLAVQLWEGKADLRRYLPTVRDRAAASALVDELRTLPGPVLMPHGPWYPVMAGHEPSVALIALWDVDHVGGPLQAGSRAFDRALRKHRWRTVVTADDKLGHGLKNTYKRKGELKAPSFRTRTGWPIRFGSVWTPTAASDESPDAPDASPEASGDPGTEGQ